MLKSELRYLLVASLALHMFALSVLRAYTPEPKPHQFEHVKLSIVHTPSPPEPPPPIPEPEKEKKKAKKKKPKPNTEKIAKKKAPPKPVLGLTEKSIHPEGKGVGAPFGNTLMDKDRGIRLDAKDIVPLDQDLSKEASLIDDSIIKPQYTQDALDAGLEGNYTVNVFVDENGRVVKATLQNKIGYDMDERVLKACQNAKFSPRLDSLGRPIPGWTKIVFALRLT